MRAIVARMRMPYFKNDNFFVYYFVYLHYILFCILLRIFSFFLLFTLFKEKEKKIRTLTFNALEYVISISFGAI